MRINRPLRLGIGAIAVTLVAAACGGGSDAATIDDHLREGKLTIGIKFDQPGLGFRDTDGSYQGYDVKIAEYVAGKLGVRPEGITFKEAPTAQRETMIMNGDVDFIVATYSITDERKRKVDFAGPYFVAGQALLVKKETTDITGVESLTGNKKLCSVEGDHRRHHPRRFRGAGIRRTEAGRRHVHHREVRYRPEEGRPRDPRQDQRCDRGNDRRRFLEESVRGNDRPAPGLDADTPRRRPVLNCRFQRWNIR
jgi:hypothetical protein